MLPGGQMAHERRVGGKRRLRVGFWWSAPPPGSAVPGRFCFWVGRLLAAMKSKKKAAPIGAERVGAADMSHLRDRPETNVVSKGEETATGSVDRVGRFAIPRFRGRPFYGLEYDFLDGGRRFAYHSLSIIHCDFHRLELLFGFGPLFGRLLPLPR